MNTTTVLPGGVVLVNDGPDKVSWSFIRVSRHRNFSGRSGHSGEQPLTRAAKRQFTRKTSRGRSKARKRDRKPGSRLFQIGASKWRRRNTQEKRSSVGNQSRVLLGISQSQSNDAWTHTLPLDFGDPGNPARIDNLDRIVCLCTRHQLLQPVDIDDLSLEFRELLIRSRRCLQFDAELFLPPGQPAGSISFLGQERGRNCKNTHKDEHKRCLHKPVKSSRGRYPPSINPWKAPSRGSSAAHSHLISSS